MSAYEPHGGLVNAALVGLGRAKELIMASKVIDGNLLTLPVGDGLLVLAQRGRVGLVVVTAPGQRRQRQRRQGVPHALKHARRDVDDAARHEPPADDPQVLGAEGDVLVRL